MVTAFITHADCGKHDMGRHHPECPERLSSIEDHLISSGISGLVHRHDAPAAKISELARVHPLEYIEAIREASPGRGIVHLDPDTAMCPHTWDAALHAAGAAVLGTDLVLGKRAENAFCAVRPPGHHATRAAAMGFCFFNNVAVAIRHALAVRGLERVALVDFDVHHGNGSEDILAGDERVLMVSTFERDLYPFCGEDAAGPNMANVALARGSTGEALRQAFEAVWKPRLEEFAPQMMFVSAGFDAHRADEMGGLRWVEDDYAWITRRIVEVAERHCDGRIVSCLEGGYNPIHLATSVAAHVRVLAGLG
jgi:acetoin utilization deacetylase AcuC-like enzyme